MTTSPTGNGSGKPFSQAKDVHIVPKVWGEEQWIVNKEYCGKKLILRKNMQCSVHHHKEKDEVFYILKGKVRMELGKKTYTMHPGDFVHVARNTPHRFTGLEASEIMEFSTTHREEDSYRTKESGHIEQERYDRQLAIIASFPKMRILVVGDAMLDCSISGHVNRVSPEAPIPVVQYISESETPGGSANAARNIASLGGNVTLIGVVGKDAYASTLDRLLKKEGVTPHLVRDASRHTTRKQRILAGSSHQLVRLDYENTEPLSEAIGRNILQLIEKELKRCDVLLLSDYAKGFFSPTMLRSCIALAKSAHVPVILDPKPRDATYARSIRGVDLMTPNKKEAMLLTGRDTSDATTLALALRHTLKTNILVTLGEHGMMLLQKTGKPRTFPALTRDVADVTGAGDTVAAVLALGLASGATLEDSVDLANRAASLVVRKHGTATTNATELASIL